MHIYTPEECKQWVSYEKTLFNPLRALTYKPDTPIGKKIINEIVADIPEKLFSHSVDRFVEGTKKQIEKYPQMESFMEDFEIHFCPNPALRFQNASCFSGQAIVLWGRTTQTLGHLTDYLVSHELGHAVQINLATRWGSAKLFREYLSLRNAPRGICKIYKGDNERGMSIYADEEDFTFLHGTQKQKEPDWDECPQEWFAEDFRYLFGVEKNPEWLLTTIPAPNGEIYDFIKSIKSLF